MTHPLADLLRREELRDSRRRQFSIARLALVALFLLGTGFLGGLWYMGGFRPEEPDHTAQAIQHLSDSLKAVNARADSIHRVDSAAMAAVLAQRPKTRAAMAPITVHDTVVVVEREAATDSTAAVADSFASPRLANAFTQMKLQLHVDSIALDSARFALRTSVARHQQDLVAQRDSLQTVHAEALTEARDAAWRKGFKAGAKTVAIGTAVIGGAITLVKAFTGGP